MTCEGQKNYACAIDHYTWMIDHGAAGGYALTARARMRLASGDRAGYFVANIGTKVM